MILGKIDPSGSCQSSPSGIFQSGCCFKASMGVDYSLFRRFVQSVMESSCALVFPSESFLIPRFELSFLRLWAKPLWMSAMNFSSLSSAISGFSNSPMCRIAESTFGAGRKCDGGIFAIIFGSPKIWTSSARTLKLPC